MSSSIDCTALPLNGVDIAKLLTGVDSDSPLGAFSAELRKLKHRVSELERDNQLLRVLAIRMFVGTENEAPEMEKLLAKQTELIRSHGELRRMVIGYIRTRPTTKHPATLTIPGAAALASRTPQWIRRLIKRRVLETTGLGRNRRVVAKSLLAYIGEPLTNDADKSH